MTKQPGLPPLFGSMVQYLLLLILIVAFSETFAAQQPLSPCRQGNTMTIDELYDYCGMPGTCSVPMKCEQKRCQIKGFISDVNIWDKRLHPWLPVSKFLLYNAARTLNVEVRVVSDEALIFQKLAAQSKSWDRSAIVIGTVVGVDLPVMTGCHRGLVIELSEVGSLIIGEKSDHSVNLD